MTSLMANWATSGSKTLAAVAGDQLSSIVVAVQFLDCQVLKAAVQESVTKDLA